MYLLSTKILVFSCLPIYIPFYISCIFSQIPQVVYKLFPSFSRLLASTGV